VTVERGAYFEYDMLTPKEAGTLTYKHTRYILKNNCKITRYNQ